MFSPPKLRCYTTTTICAISPCEDALIAPLNRRKSNQRYPWMTTICTRRGLRPRVNHTRGRPRVTRPRVHAHIQRAPHSCTNSVFLREQICWSTTPYGVISWLPHEDTLLLSCLVRLLIRPCIGASVYGLVIRVCGDVWVIQSYVTIREHIGRRITGLVNQ